LSPEAVVVARVIMQCLVVVVPVPGDIELAH
jgi:hypothetical protein